MPLPLPNLDDRTYQQLLDEARRHIARSAPGWTDLGPGDPGIVLLELFAYLTDTMIYRLNRLPEKAYIAFLRLLNVVLQPPAAASVTLRFSRSRVGDQPVAIPRGTRVAVNRADAGGAAPTFVTARGVTIGAGETAAEVLAFHCTEVEGELAGVGTGLPGLSVKAQHAPIIAPTGDELDLVVAVAATPDELDERAPAIQFNGQAYRIWREVDSFAQAGDDPRVYLVDRMAGLITFAPAVRRQTDAGFEDVPQALAAVPAARREIRLWYRYGGGPDGNVTANTLTVLKDALPGIEVMNPQSATGGRAAETLANALIRGPHELHSLQRAVTASDFEWIALSASRGIARATALTRAALWTFATPGTVEVLLVPYLPDAEQQPGQVTIAALQARQTEAARQPVQQTLDERRPLGTACLVNWAHYKRVRVTARVVTGRAERTEVVRQRVLERLYQTITPLPTPMNPTGWPFGQALRASHVYDMALAEPGVRWVDDVRLWVDDVPDGAVTCVAADAFQPHTWYAGTGETLFRTVNDGDGWEAAGRFEGEAIEVVAVHPQRAGLVAVLTRQTAGGSRLHVSADCGETWTTEPQTTAFTIHDIAWILRENVPAVLMASEVGLYELVLRPGGSPVQLLVDPADQDAGFYAVAATTDVRGALSVAAAAMATGGLFLSSDGGRANTFRQIGLRGQDIRVLAVQYDGPRAFLWAGAAAPGGDVPGSGCFRWELRGSQDPPEGWQSFGNGWLGGSCRALAFQGTSVLAGTHHAGVVRLNTQTPDPVWIAADVGSGLPLRDRGRFQPVDALAADPAGQRIMAGGGQGVFRSLDNGVTYRSCSARDFADKVTLPPTWLFVSGEHDLTVISEDEAQA